MVCCVYMYMVHDVLLVLYRVYWRFSYCVCIAILRTCLWFIVYCTYIWWCIASGVWCTCINVWILSMWHAFAGYLCWSDCVRDNKGPELSHFAVWWRPLLLLSSSSHHLQCWVSALYLRLSLYFFFLVSVKCNSHLQVYFCFSQVLCFSLMPKVSDREAPFWMSIFWKRYREIQIWIATFKRIIVRFTTAWLPIILNWWWYVLPFELLLLPFRKRYGVSHYV
jgi:hypothetical protein